MSKNTFLLKVCIDYTKKTNFIYFSIFISKKSHLQQLSSQFMNRQIFHFFWGGGRKGRQHWLGRSITILLQRSNRDNEKGTSILSQKILIRYGIGFQCNNQAYHCITLPNLKLTIPKYFKIPCPNISFARPNPLLKLELPDDLFLNWPKFPIQIMPEHVYHINCYNVIRPYCSGSAFILRPFFRATVPFFGWRHQTSIASRISSKSVCDMKKSSQTLVTSQALKNVELLLLLLLTLMLSEDGVGK